MATAVTIAAPLVGILYDEPRTVEITIVLASMIVVGTFGMIPNALLSRQMRFTTQAAIDVGSLAVGIATSIAAAVAGLDYWSLILGQVASTVAGIIATWRLWLLQSEESTPGPTGRNHQTVVSLTLVGYALPT